MSQWRYLLNDWWTAVELDRIDSRLLVRGASQRRKQGDLARDTARVALVTRALAELMIAKGLITKAELLAQIVRTDLEDGAADGELDPELVLPGSKKTPPAPRQRKAASSEVLARAQARVAAARQKKHKGPGP
jgi:hypothetical protein